MENNFAWYAMPDMLGRHKILPHYELISIIIETPNVVFPMHKGNWSNITLDKCCWSPYFREKKLTSVAVVFPPMQRIKYNIYE